MSNNHDNEEKHVYDDIVELDNQLPQWWRNLFYVTIVFSVIYVAYYEFGDGMSIQQEFEADMAAISQKKSTQPEGSSVSESKLLAFYKDSEKLTQGKNVYVGRCASCHAGNGGGGIGPNLADNFWINGDGKIVAIANIIRDGVAAKGMPPWQSMLTEDELYAVAAYVKSLKGTNPAGAKQAQGQEYKD